MTFVNYDMSQWLPYESYYNLSSNLSKPKVNMTFESFGFENLMAF